MTRIDVIRTESGVTISVIGHAKGEKGSNVLCAAISMNAQLLEQTVADLAEEGELRCGNVDKSDGKLIVSFTPDSRFEADVVRCVGVVLRGFEMLADKYPDDFRLSGSL